MTELEKILTTPSSVASFRELILNNYPNVIIRPATDFIGENYVSCGINMYNHFYLVDTEELYTATETFNIIVNPRDNSIHGLLNTNSDEIYYGIRESSVYIILSHEAIDFSNLRSLYTDFQKSQQATKFKDFALTELKPILDEVHGENYDFQIDTAYLDVIIRYPHITITNSSNKSREIEELYCVLTFNVNKQLTQFTGFRAKMSFNDVKNGYRHSHLNTRGIDDLFTKSGFCTGSTDLTALKCEFMEEFNADRFDLLLYQINNFVEWESIEGTPYIQLGSANNRNLQLLNRTSIDSVSITNDFNKFCNALKEDSTIFKPVLSYGNTTGSRIQASILNRIELAMALAPYSTYFGYLDDEGSLHSISTEQYDNAATLVGIKNSLNNTPYKTFRNNLINYEATATETTAEYSTEFCSQELLYFAESTLQNLLSDYHSTIQAKNVYLSRDNIENLVLMS